MSERRRIVLGNEDFADTTETGPAPAGGPAALPEGGTLPPVARRAPIAVTDDAVPPPPNAPPVGHAPPPAMPPIAAGPGPYAQMGHVVSGTNPLNDARWGSLIFAAVGVFLGWAITEIFGIADISVTSKLGSDAVSGLWTGIIGMVFAAALLASDRIVNGAVEEGVKRAAFAAGPGLAVGFASGFIANVVYLQILQRVVTSLDFSMHDYRFYLARLLGWAIFGAGIGTTIGLVARSGKRAINGAIGGVLGGAIGGVIFQFTATEISSQDFSTTQLSSQGISRLLGLMAVGLLIAGATRVVETARRDAWVRVTSGGMSGKEFILYHQVTRVGASPECEMYLLKDPAIARVHAQVTEQGSQRILTVAPGAPTMVNGQPVTMHTLRNGDQIQLGSTVLSYSERAAIPTPAMATPTMPFTSNSREDRWT